MKITVQQRWAKLIASSAILAAVFNGLAIEPVGAVSITPAPVCIGSSCTVTFDYTGDYFAWSPPIGAKNLTFDLAGAQGASAAAFGGRVTGALASIPSTLYIFVGGAGLRGSGALGGFNGGGNAGTGGADAGSGGGATDIRTSIALADRIAVAGGGGGQAGVTGGIGGAAGGVTGSSGVGGQGGAGTGGSATAGGSAGFAGVGATAATVGSSGKGGNGGSSAYSGGGGGGGGYFGGGGGGGDADNCCSNGGGGGGGSSWVNATLVSSTTNTAAYRTGAGRAMLSYQMPPSVISFQAASQVSNAASVTFNLQFSESVSGLSSADFTIAGSATACQPSVSGSGATYAVAVSSCSSGTLALSLLANSVQGVLAGPAVAVTADSITLDYANPTATIASPGSPNNSSLQNFVVTFSEPVTGLASSDFEVLGAGCQLASVSGSQASYNIQVSNCTDAAQLHLNLAPNSVNDVAGNLGPAELVSSSAVLIDLLAPNATITVPNSPSNQAAVTVEIQFSEQIVGLAESDLQIAGAGCLIDAMVAEGNLVFVTISNCTDSLQINLLAGSVTDVAQNSGPVGAVNSETIIFDLAAPTATWSSAQTETQSAASFELRFSEAITGLADDDFVSVGTSLGCRLTLSEVSAGTNYRVEVIDCQVGQISLALRSGAVFDAVLNAGPTSETISPTITMLAVPVVIEPTPEPTVEPTPAPIAPTPAPVDVEPSFEPSPTPVPEPEPTASPAPQPSSSPMPISESAESESRSFSTNSNQDSGSEAVVIVPEGSGNDSNGPDTEIEAGPEPSDSPTFSWPTLDQVQTWLLSAVAAALAGIAAVVIAKLLSKVRRRRIVRLFGV
ncbi:MAG: hypothetical protein RIQ31_848 [Actinomycetota bacterium]